MTTSLLPPFANPESFVAMYRCCSKLLRDWIVSEPARLLPMSSTTLPGIFSLTLFERSIDKIAPFPSCRPPP